MKISQLRRQRFGGHILRTVNDRTIHAQLIARNYRAGRIDLDDAHKELAEIGIGFDLACEILGLDEDNIEYGVLPVDIELQIAAG